MSKKKLGISTFDINKKFTSEDIAYKYAKRLREFIRYVCNKKKWSAQAIICISNIKGNNSFLYYEHNGQVGRPKINIYTFEKDINVHWHIHVLLVSIPCYSFREEIKKYIDKNWYDIENSNDNFDYGKIVGRRKVYKKNCNIGKAEYYMAQSKRVIFCNYNNNLIPKGYTLKNLYYAYIKSKTAMKNAIKYGNDKRIELNNKYYNILEFYYKLTKEEDKKQSEIYIKKIQLTKIEENYERQNNKVQKDFNIHHKRIFDNTNIKTIFYKY